MADWVRLFGRLFPRQSEGRKVETLTVRVRALVPAGGTVHIADVQCQPGDKITGWTLHSSDLGLTPVEGWELRNGVFRGPQTMVVTADTALASPLRVDAEPLNTAAAVRVGGYRFGTINTGGAARVDGLEHTATQGAGLPPHLTARADVDLDLEQPATARSRVLLWLRGITTVTSEGAVSLPVEDPEPEPEPTPDPGLEPVPGEPDPNDPDPPEVP